MTRVYHLTKRLKSREFVLVGIFTNRKPLLEALETCGLEDCYIKGYRKSKPINKGTIATSFENRALEIYKTDYDNLKEYVQYRAIEVVLNRVNPQLVKENDYA